MAQSRRVLENPFGKSLDQSKVCGTNHVAWEVISMRFYLLTKDLKGAGFPTP